MSYEIEAMSTETQSSPAMPVMREERMVDPYAVRPSLKAVPAPEKAPEETVRLSPQLAALARREQKFRQQQAQLENQRKTIAAEQEELAQLRSMREKLAAKDYSALEGLIDYNDYSQYQVNKINGSDPLREELAALNGKISELEQTTQSTVEQGYENALNERRVAVRELVNQENFPTIAKAGAQEYVIQHIRDTWEEDGEELSIEQATREVEEALLESAQKAEKWASSILRKEEEKKPLPQLKPSLKTLTNQVTTSEAKRPYRSFQGMSDTERLAEARRRAEEKLQLNVR
jgi:hypothetical protein